MNEDEYIEYLEDREAELEEEVNELKTEIDKFEEILEERKKSWLY